MSGNEVSRSQPIQLQLLCAAILLSNLVHVVVAVILQSVQGLPIMEADTLPVFFPYLLLFLGLSAAAFSFMVRKALLMKLPARPTMQHLTGPIVIAMAMAESSGVLGLLVVLLTGEWIYAGLLWGTGIGVGIFHYPTAGMITRLLDDEHRDSLG